MTTLHCLLSSNCVELFLVIPHTWLYHSAIFFGHIPSEHTPQLISSHSILFSSHLISFHLILISSHSISFSSHLFIILGPSDRGQCGVGLSHHSLRMEPTGKASALWWWSSSREAQNVIKKKRGKERGVFQRQILLPIGCSHLPSIFFVFVLPNSLPHLSLPPQSPSIHMLPMHCCLCTLRFYCLLPI
jgi:hypothetical protein